MGTGAIDTRTVHRGVRVLALGSLLGLVGVLLWLLPRPGAWLGRYVLFAGIVAFCAIGAFGVVRRRPRLALLGAGGIYLLGFWQAVLAVFMLPVAGLLLLVAAIDWVIARDAEGDPATPVQD